MKKLIEVAIPLDVINKASAREKSIRHGHPSTLHLWWARRPLATARAVLFASLVDDPSEHPEKFPTPEAQESERQRLFKLIAELVEWEKSSDEKLFAQALDEIKKSCGNELPAVFDPFAGGGTIPLEAQRLGLKSFAADLNPVAVMINKAMIELPAKFKNLPPVNPTGDKNRIGGWRGAEGLAEDILYYGKLLKSKAFDEIGKLYPKIDDKTVIAWLWARTVTCSNPACGCRMPLVHSFKLSTRQKIFAKPIVDGDKIHCEICHYDDDKEIPEGTVDRNGARCLFCGTNNPLAHVREQAKAGNMSAQLMAIVAEGDNGRIYLAPDETHEKIADVPKPEDFPEGEIPYAPRYLTTPAYGLENFSDLFTNRQLTAVTTFSDLIDDIRGQIIDDGGDKNYSDAVAVYLSFLIDKLADRNSSICNWDSSRDGIRNTFGRQAIPMNWDFAEVNPFSNSSGCFDNMLDWIFEVAKNFPAKIIGTAERHSALEKFSFDKPVMVSSDPPYYDNIGYADLSEFFYVWMRRSLKSIYPKLFGRMTFAKNDELIAEPARHDGDQTAAKTFFEDGMFQVLQNIHDAANEKFPVTIYYAFKQKDSDDGASTGWETMLSAIIKAGFQITGTEKSNAFARIKCFGVVDCFGLPQTSARKQIPGQERIFAHAQSRIENRARRNEASDNRACRHGSSGDRPRHCGLFVLRKNCGHDRHAGNNSRCAENHQRGTFGAFGQPRQEFGQGKSSLRRPVHSKRFQRNFFRRSERFGAGEKYFCGRLGQNRRGDFRQRRCSLARP